MKKYSLLLFFLLCTVQYHSFAQSLTLESSAFKMNSIIPDAYTCKAGDHSPPLNWNNVPPNTQSLAVIMDDPDSPSGIWTHWILFNIPPTLTQLDAGSAVPQGAATGINSWGSTDYRGPCPPTGVAHTYYFKLYALDTVINLGNGTSRDILLNAMTGHVIGSAELTGLYQKF